MRYPFTLLLSLILVLMAPFALAGEDGSTPIEIGKSYNLPSKVLDQTRRINVYLPPSYADGKSSYPVLFLLDGGVQEDLIHIVGLASLAAPYRNIREFIVVGIEGIDRRHDMTHNTEVAADKKLIPNFGGAPAFRKFLSDELKPWVAQHLRITDETVLIGESAAGLFVVETFLRQPELFGGYIAVSPSLWWDGMSLSKEAASLLQKQPYPAKRRFYMTLSSEGGDMLGGVDLVVKALKEHAAKDLDWTYVPMKDEDHGTTFHPAALNAIRKFFVTPTKFQQ